MIAKNRNRRLVVVGLVLLIAASAAAKPRKLQRVAAGSWGAPHIRLNVEQNSATIGYDCAHGAIAGPLTFDSKGRFSWRGTHTPEHGGPIRIDEPSTSRQAIYTGAVQGDTMTLTVRLANTKELIGTFTLKRGGAGRVFKCQ